jgi:formylmethanofuran dehydrogenase subunit E
MEIRSYRGKLALKEYEAVVRDFHGHLAPGVLMGGFMVDWALEVMEPCQILDALVETRKCLPDAVQILTKCTIGNGWLRILDQGKLSLILYDKETMHGARVCLDPQRLCQFPLIRAWAMKERSKKENPLDPLIEEMMHAGRRIFGCQEVVVDKIPGALPAYSNPKICPICHEPFRYGTHGICVSCADPFFHAKDL